VSNDINNQHSPVVVVAALTTKVSKKPYPQNLRLPAGRPLKKESTILGGQLTTIDKTRLETYCASLEADQVSELDDALRVSLALR
jgi:mRNA interferase MazF